MNYSYDDVKEALDFIQSFTNIKPLTAIVSGSGLGDIAEMIEGRNILDASLVPHWPYSTAPGHSGNIITGTISGRNIIMLQGRVHYYEGYDMADVVFPVRVLGMMGVREYIAANASGAINRTFKAGDIIAVRDHINFMGSNPLIGPNDSRWGVRFPDMTTAYDPDVLKILDSFGLKQGVYAAFTGPSFETPAEVNMAGILGADLAGMSTVPEIITANSMGMRCAVLSCVANMAAGIDPDHVLTSEEVLEVMKGTSNKLSDIIIRLIKSLNQE